MTQFAKETLPVSLEEEMRRSYLDYAMSVIVGRALPDARDGSQHQRHFVQFLHGSPLGEKISQQRCANTTSCVTYSPVTFRVIVP